MSEPVNNISRNSMGSRELFSQTSKHVVAMFHANPIELLMKGSVDCVRGHQATLTLIKYDGHCFGVTNQHVAMEGSISQHVFYVALKTQQSIPGRLLFQSTQDSPDLPFDLAVFLLNEAAIRDGGKDPIDLEQLFEPLSEGDQAVAVGFPGIERRLENPVQMSHGLYHVVAQCRCASDRKLVLQEDLSPPEGRRIMFGGMSGGAIFRLTSRKTYTFSGIVFAGRGFDDKPGDDDTRQRNADRRHQVWIYGFPFGPKELDHGLGIFHPDL